MCDWSVFMNTKLKDNKLFHDKTKLLHDVICTFDKFIWRVEFRYMVVYALHFESINNFTFGSVNFFL